MLSASEKVRTALCVPLLSATLHHGGGGAFENVVKCCHLATEPLDGKSNPLRPLPRKTLDYFAFRHMPHTGSPSWRAANNWKKTSLY